MEFHRTVPYMHPDRIRLHFRLNNLEEWSDSLIPLGPIEEETMEIGGIWGEFRLNRQELAHGLRFSLLDCPQALAWSISSVRTDSISETVLHLTVNRPQVCSELVEEIEAVLDELCAEVGNGSRMEDEDPGVMAAPLSCPIVGSEENATHQSPVALSQRSE